MVEFLQFAMSDRNKMLTNKTAAGLVQLLQALSQDDVRLLLFKHLDIDLNAYRIDTLLRIVTSSCPEGLAGLIVEVAGGSTEVRANAPRKYVFDKRHEHFCGLLRSDGFEVLEDSLGRLLPTAEPLVRIRDHLEEVLANSGLDNDGEIRRLLGEAYASMSVAVPDFNGATTKARIVLETVARRSAKTVAAARSRPPSQDTWGAALEFLRYEEVITKAEEEALAKVYTLISPGSHVPRGLTAEQWALLARSFAVSGAYFLLHRHLA